MVDDQDGFLKKYPNLLPLTNYNSWFVIEVPKALKDVPFELSLIMNGKIYKINI